MVAKSLQRGLLVAKSSQRGLPIAKKAHREDVGHTDGSTPARRGSDGNEVNVLTE